MATPKRRNASKADRGRSSFADRETEVARFKRERDEALEQQKATSEVLRVISSSPGDLEPVFAAILRNATRVCEARFGTLWLAEGDGLRAVATHNAPPGFADVRRETLIRRNPKTAVGRVLITKQPVQIVDLAADVAYAERDPLRVALVDLAGARSLVAVPMLRDDVLVGTINIYRQEIGPFTDKQIELVQNFATQAVIAIENTRLLNELRQRTDDLTESLEQQTATSEVLRVISSSPGELKPVFEAMLENATRICNAKFGVLMLSEEDAFRIVALHGAPPAYADERWREPVIKPHPDVAIGRVVATKQPVQIADIRSQPAYTSDPKRSALLELAGARTMLAVPMLKDSEIVGQFAIYRQEVRPFTDKQIALVQNFAAQAVIAIENARLLNELRESLEQQTATSEVLRVISSSPGNLAPVFEAVLESATRICEARFGTLFRFDGDRYHLAAQFGTPPDLVEFQRQRGPFRPPPGGHLDEVTKTKHIRHTADEAADPNPGKAATLGAPAPQFTCPCSRTMS
jgi:GAF domain-containing protein